ncbi:MAG TPA: hypothetical protein VJ436_02520, partial [Anaerolineales bacterium]|nr:hypothetical protein [Anaerolineales bacterium]
EPAAPAAPETTTPTPTTPAEEPTLSFEPAAYRDETLGFELLHPAGWLVEDPETLGDRAYQVKFTDGSGPRLNLIILQWDPKNDLAAYVAQRKLAWEGSGLTLVSEETLSLEGGVQAARFVVQTPEGEQVLFFFTPVGDRYLELNGTGDLVLLAEITGTVRSLRTEGQAGGLEPIDCSAGEADQLSWVACNVMAGITSRNLSALHGFMSDPFTIGYWGSEGRTAPPEEITAELAQYRLPPDPSSPLTFTTDQSQFPPLSGQPPADLFGPDLNVAAIIYSEGWGLNSQAAALIYIVQNEAGEYRWHAMAYSDSHFDQ